MKLRYHIIGNDPVEYEAIRYNGRNQVAVAEWAFTEFGREIDLTGLLPDSWLYHDPQREGGPLCMTSRGVDYNFEVIE